MSYQPTMKSRRAAEMGKRPVRVANCSGFHGDPAEEMYRQATLGDVDFITGDYLAEVNLANNAEAYLAGKHPGFERTAWEGLEQSIDVIAERGIKVAINGGALNPQGLAEMTRALIDERGYDLTVAYVTGDNLRPVLGQWMPTSLDNFPKHLDSQNSHVVYSPIIHAFLNEKMNMVSANAYMGARGIVKAFENGADIVICGRVSDASPVIAAAWYWHSWNETDYNKLAGGLIAGHLIECSAYVTGGNFSGFHKYDLETLILPGYPIAEIHADGTCVITKHENTGGMVNVDTVRCQLLYELQGNVYLHSDSKAYLDDVVVEQIGKDRVLVTGIRGRPPPSTTKLAIFYRGGYECQLLLNATGYATSKKWDLVEKQIRYFLGAEGAKDLELLEFQRIGVPATNPASQEISTTYLRIFAEAHTEERLRKLVDAYLQVSLRHFSGFHSARDARTAQPKPFLAYYPALYSQNDLDERTSIISPGGKSVQSYSAGHPPSYEELGERENYNTASPITIRGPQKTVRLGDIALARSGDKGSNLNFGVFTQRREHWDWLRTYMSRERMQALLGGDGKDEFFIERVEFHNISAVHFVIYGILGRGVSSSGRLDGFGKGFADYILDKFIEVPIELL